jgi:hypothetical protein
MSQILDRGIELIRINPKNSREIEYSSNGGSFWSCRYAGSNSVGYFQDLAEHGNEILATTSEGLFYTTNEGLFWSKRY